MNLIKLTKFTGDINSNQATDEGFTVYIDYETIDTIEDTSNGTEVKGVTKGGLGYFYRVMEEADEIYEMILRIERGKYEEKIQNIALGKPVDAISTDYFTASPERWEDTIPKCKK